MMAPAQMQAAAGQAAEILALTLYAEAGTRPVRAIEALAALVVNRARASLEDDQARLRFAPGLRWTPERGQAAFWPLLLGPVCRAPFQFPCWNPCHARHAMLRHLPVGDAALAVCRRIAARAAAGTLADPTGGATHLHAVEELPAWAVGQEALFEVGGLVFYRLAG
jgi:spore germination cell wall hydrolase CwlJ-like protein